MNAASTPYDLFQAGQAGRMSVSAARRGPALTTIALPHYEMGRPAVQLALGSGPGADPRQVALPCRLVTRKST